MSNQSYGRKRLRSAATDSVLPGAAAAGVESDDFDALINSSNNNRSNSRRSQRLERNDNNNNNNNNAAAAADDNNFDSLASAPGGPQSQSIDHYRAEWDHSTDFLLTPSTHKSLDKYSTEELNKLIGDVSRYCLYCQSANKPIKLSNITKLVLADRAKGQSITIIRAAANYLKNVFGLNLVWTRNNNISNNNNTNRNIQSKSANNSNSKGASATAASGIYFLINADTHYNNESIDLYTDKNQSIKDNYSQLFLLLILSIILLSDSTADNVSNNSSIISEKLLYKRLEECLGFNIKLTKYHQYLGDLDIFISQQLVKLLYLDRIKSTSIDSNNNNNAGSASAAAAAASTGTDEYSYRAGVRSLTEIGELAVYNWLCINLLEEMPDPARVEEIKKRQPVNLSATAPPAPSAAAAAASIAQSQPQSQAQSQSEFNFPSQSQQSQSQSQSNSSRSNRARR